jgi:Ca2+-binding RTX toxin-like protein
MANLPDNSTTSVVVSVDFPFSNTIASGDPGDWVQLEVEAGTQYILYVSATFDGFIPALYNAAETIVVNGTPSDDAGAGTDPLLVFTPPALPLYAEVRAFGSGAGGAYEVVLVEAFGLNIVADQFGDGADTFDDIAFEADGNDFVAGGRGDDYLDGWIGDDVVIGGPGDDQILGSSGFDRLYGGGGADNIVGERDADVIFGGTENDTIDGGRGNDFVSGDAGNDVLRGGRGPDILDGGAGTDTAAYDTSIAAVRVRLGTGLAEGGDALGDALFGIENLTGSVFGDLLAGDATANTLLGNGGNDLLRGLAGADRLGGSTGADRFQYLALGDSTVAAGGRDTILDFAPAQGDRIELSAIDARSGTAGDQAFVLVGAFTGAQGQLRRQVNGTYTQLDGDVNGDGASDFRIVLAGFTGPLSAGDFIL